MITGMHCMTGRPIKRCNFLEVKGEYEMAFYYFFLGGVGAVALRPIAGHGLILEVSRSHATTYHSQWDFSGRVISSSQRPTWQHTTLTTDKHPCPQWDSNPRSQQAQTYAFCVSYIQHNDLTIVTLFFSSQLLLSVYSSSKALI
jgi:hypothetical protein